MKRQNKDGRPIYSDKIWKRMLWIGENLEKIGYKESNKRPNLFYKQFTNNGVNGVIFADLRGTDIIPIWADASPITYYKDVSFKRYIKEVILLKRNKCFPRTTFYQDSEPDGWAFGIGIPDGYCKGCEKDIIHETDWDLLENGIYNEKIENNGSDRHLEVLYCNDCKNQKELNNNHNKKEGSINLRTIPE